VPLLLAAHSAHPVCCLFLSSQVSALPSKSATLQVKVDSLHAGLTSAIPTVFYSHKQCSECFFTLAQVSALSSKCTALQVKVKSLRDDHSKLLGRLADVTSKWQATVVENAALNAKNGELQAQLGEVQHAVAMLQREREELRRMLQKQQPALCQQQQQQQQHSRQMQLAMFQQQQQQQQQQQVAWVPGAEHVHSGVLHHAAGAAHWAQW
jgi:hypothetical protein